MKALKNILKKGKPSALLIESLCNHSELEIAIVNSSGLILWGSSEYQRSHSYPIASEDQELAVLYASNQKGKEIAELINLFVKKEVEKRKIGTEVLGLYREINMIYDFSEKISEKIDVGSIADTTLSEASQIIDSTHGRLFIYQADTDQIIELASFGPYPSNDADTIEYADLLKQIILKGSSAIVPQKDLDQYPMLGYLKTLMYAPLKVKHRTLGLVMLGHNEHSEFTAAALKLLTTIALQAASAIETANLYERGLKEANEREDAIRKIHEISTKFVPFEFIRSLGKSKLTEVGLGDQVERTVTVMFADIRDFTSFSETLAPEDNFLFINAFNKRMGPIIRQHRGFINQYLGDGFMAIFPHGSQDALNAAVQMHRTLEDYNKLRVAKNRIAINMGIGMQSGKLIMGITGDVERMEAATISDTVNTAARIEGLSKHYGTSILFTGDCMADLSDPGEFDYRYLGLVQVKGRQQPLQIFECINGDSIDLFTQKLNSLSTFDKGMEQYFDREFAMSALTFQQIVKSNPEDKTARLFLNRSANLITKELDAEWKGVESMQLK